MTAFPVRTHYGWPLIGLHWVTLALLMLVYATAELSDVFPKGSAGRASVRNLHESLGLLVFGMVWLRLTLRAFAASPAIVPTPPRWQVLLATLVHVALYVLMIAVPLSGWLMLNADGKALVWFGTPLPVLVAPNAWLADVLEDVHEAIAQAGYALVGLHAAAAVFHHYLLRDNTLRLMWPALRSAR